MKSLKARTVSGVLHKELVYLYSSKMGVLIFELRLQDEHADFMVPGVYWNTVPADERYWLYKFKEMLEEEQKAITRVA